MSTLRTGNTKGIALITQVMRNPSNCVRLHQNRCSFRSRGALKKCGPDANESYLKLIRLADPGVLLSARRFSSLAFRVVLQPEPLQGQSSVVEYSKLFLFRRHGMVDAYQPRHPEDSWVAGKEGPSRYRREQTLAGNRPGFVSGYVQRRGCGRIDEEIELRIKVRVVPELFLVRPYLGKRDTIPYLCDYQAPLLINCVTARHGTSLSLSRHLMPARRREPPQCNSARGLLGERGRIRTCDPCLKRTCRTKNQQLARNRMGCDRVLQIPCPARLFAAALTIGSTR